MFFVKLEKRMNKKFNPLHTCHIDANNVAALAILRLTPVPVGICRVDIVKDAVPLAWEKCLRRNISPQCPANGVFR